MRYIISSLLSILPFATFADVPRVITDLPPVYGLVAQVMGDLGQPVLLLDRGADAHDFQLRPSQMGNLAGADIAFWIGPEMTPWFERALQAGGAGISDLRLLEVEGTHRQDFGVMMPAGEIDHKEDDAGDHHDHDGHDHGGSDPHAWLNPQNAAPWLDAIADALSGHDAENAAVYAANAAAAKAEIAALDAEIAALLAPYREKGFVTYHDAYGYFAQHYGLAYRGAIAMGDASLSGAAHLRAVQDQIAHGMTCIFPEAQHDSQMLLQLIEGTPVRAGGPLDPEGALLKPNRATYLELLGTMANTIAACLDGA